MTANELCRVAGAGGLWKRLSELKSLGLAEETTVRPCNVTGKSALVWKAIQPIGVLQRPPKGPKPRVFYLSIDEATGTVHQVAKSRARLESYGSDLFGKIIKVREIINK